MTASPFKWISDKDWQAMPPWKKVSLINCDFTSCNDYDIEYDERGNIIWEA